MAPMIVTDSAAPEALTGVGSLEIVGRQCKLEGYKKLENIPSFEVKNDFIAFASPDSTYAVTKRLLDAAQKSILIGIYDFSAEYIKDILLNAMQRGVKLSLMLDLDDVKGEMPIFKELKRFGCEAVPAPSCASKNANYFSSSHEKVIVIDGTWTIVQSGNYSNNSIPLNEQDGGDPDAFVKGNRDMGVAVRSKPLATFFTKVLRSDIKLELDAAEGEALPRERIRELPELVEAVPELLPTKLFKSKTLKPSETIRVIPVLSPDNYMDVIPDFLESAKKSILIEQQYIRGTQKAITKLLTAIRKSKDKNPDLDVRIILGKIFSKKDIKKERQNLLHIRKEFALNLGSNIRFIDTKRFVHCHNKLIVVDDKVVLVSSQNWSDAAVLRNREAGLLMEYPEIARYYSTIFEADWKTAVKNLPKAKPETITPEVLARGNFVKVVAADYQEV